MVARAEETFFTHLECSRTGESYEKGEIQHVSRAGAPLLARYDTARARASFQPDALTGRPFNIWRYRELLPLANTSDILSLGEGGTPLLQAHRQGARLGLSRLYIKDEGLNPTASFKVRGMAVAVSMAVALGAKELAVASAGNAGGALAAYAARAGLPAHIVVPRDAPRGSVAEAEAFGAEVTYVDGLIGDAGRLVAERSERHGWYDLSTLKEPYRLEGKKTMGYELFEQLDRTLPDVILYPTGGGTGLVGMWKAFDEMEALGWIGSGRPRLVSVQSTGCAPLKRAMESGALACTPWENAATIAPGLRVPKALGDFLILRALRETKGRAVAVTDDELMKASRALTETEGIFACPEGGACLAALESLVDESWVGKDETVILFNTASGAKYF